MIVREFIALDGNSTQAGYILFDKDNPDSDLTIHDGTDVVDILFSCLSICDLDELSIYEQEILKFKRLINTYCHMKIQGIDSRREEILDARREASQIDWPDNALDEADLPEVDFGSCSIHQAYDEYVKKEL